MPAPKYWAVGVAPGWVELRISPTPPTRRRSPLKLGKEVRIQLHHVGGRVKGTISLPRFCLYYTGNHSYLANYAYCHAYGKDPVLELSSTMFDILLKKAV